MSLCHGRVERHCPFPLAKFGCVNGLRIRNITPPTPNTLKVFANITNLLYRQNSHGGNLFVYISKQFDRKLALINTWCCLKPLSLEYSAIIWHFTWRKDTRILRATSTLQDTVHRHSTLWFSWVRLPKRKAKKTPDLRNVTSLKEGDGFSTKAFGWRPDSMFRLGNNDGFLR